MPPIRLLLVLPVLGWLTSSASNLTVRWFFIFNLPNLTGPDPQLAKLTKELHDLGAWCLLALRVPACGGGLLARVRVEGRCVTPHVALMDVASGVTMKTSLRALSCLILAWSVCASAACWKPVTSPKSLTFTASQGGAPFPGEFKSYSAQLCLDDKDASRDSLRVDVDLNSVDTGLDEMDAALKDDDFFDTAKYPKGTFVSDSLKQVSLGHYVVTGKLSLHGVTKAISVPFTWTPLQVASRPSWMPNTPCSAVTTASARASGTTRNTWVWAWM